jgi:hypothetical protein
MNVPQSLDPRMIDNVPFGNLIALLATDLISKSNILMNRIEREIRLTEVLHCPG